jgi:branched-chain amino acid transport system permease protein
LALRAGILPELPSQNVQTPDAGIAGALGALLSAFVAPDSFPVFLSIKFLVGSVVGGIISISGAFIGALFIEFTPNFADQISKAAPDAIFGMFLIALMYLFPEGAVGVLSFITVRLRRVAGAKNTPWSYLAIRRRRAKDFAGGALNESQGAARVSKE